MNPTTSLVKIEEIIVQVCFYAPLAFLVIYSVRTPWWRTVHGRTLAALAFVFVFVLLRSMLFIWGALSLRSEESPDILSWISVFVLLLAPLAFATMTWQLIRKPLRQWWHWMREGSPDRPLTGDARPDFTGTPQPPENRQDNGSPADRR